MKDAKTIAQEYFETLWREAEPKIVAGEIVPARMRDGSTDPVDYCLSTVSRVSSQPDSTAFLQNVDTQLNGFFGAAQGQFWYPHASLHISLVGCTPRETTPQAFSEERREKIKSICQNALLNQHGVEVLFQGVGLIGNQVFLQGFPQDNRWEQLRTTVIEHLLRAGEQPIAYVNRAPIHMNIMRITDTSDGTLEKIYKVIEKLREAHFGSIRFTTIEFVLTDFVLSKSNVQSLARYKLD